MSPPTACIRSTWRRRSASLAVGALLAVAAPGLGGCSWTEEEWRYLASPGLCGIAFNCGGTGNSNMGNQAQSDSDDSNGNGNSNTSTGEGTGEAATAADAQ